MRTGLITVAAVALGLAAVPSFVQAGPAVQNRVETRTTTRDVRTQTQTVRSQAVSSREIHPAARQELPQRTTVVHENIQRNNVVVRDEHIQRTNVMVRDEHRDVHVDEHVIVDNSGRRWDHDHWIVPVPVVTVNVPVSPYFCTPVTIDQIPAVVLDAVAQQTGGAAIASVDYLSNAGGYFYDVRVLGPYNTTQTLRFAINGGFCGNM